MDSNPQLAVSGSNTKLRGKKLVKIFRFQKQGNYFLLEKSDLENSNLSDPKHLKTHSAKLWKNVLTEQQQTFVYTKPFYHYICTLVVVQLCKLSVFWPKPNSLVSLTVQYFDFAIVGRQNVMRRRRDLNLHYAGVMP